MGLRNAEVIARAADNPFVSHQGSNLMYKPFGEPDNTSTRFVLLGHLVSYTTPVATLVANTHSDTVELWITTTRYSPTTYRQLSHTSSTWRNGDFKHAIVSAWAGRPMRTTPRTFYVDNLNDRTEIDADAITRHVLKTMRVAAKSITQGARHLRDTARVVHNYIRNAAQDVPTPSKEVEDLHDIEMSLLEAALQADVHGNHIARAFAQAYIALNQSTN